MTTFNDRPNTALVVIDMQRDVVGEAHDLERVVANINTLVDKARAEQVPVVWVQHADEEMPQDSDGWQYIDELQRNADEPLVHKHYGDSFEETELESVLAERGVGRLVVTGAQTDACIRSTLHGALVRGYDATLVGDAHTTEDMRKWGLPIGPADAIEYTNQYWSFSSAPGRRGDTVSTAEVEFSEADGSARHSMTSPNDGLEAAEAGARRLLDELPRPIGFVLGGGGSLGAAQVGMLEALHDQQIHADLVAGTSIGALNGAIVAADPIGAASRLSHIWHTLDAKAILPGGIVRRAWTLWRSKTHLYDSPLLAELIENEIGDVHIEDLAIPYAAIALDVETATAVRFTSGPVNSAMLASSAIPGVFPAVERDGRRYYDGGLVTNVPVLDALAMGAKSLVVLDSAFPDQTISAPTTMVETIFYSMMVQQRQQVLRELPIAAVDVPVLYLPGPAPVIVSPLDFDSTPALIRESYDTARAFLADVRVDGAGLYRAIEPERESELPGEAD